MKVTIVLTAWFKRYTSGKSEIKIEVEHDVTAIEAVTSCGIPLEEVGFITINNKKVGNDQILEDGDIVKVYTFILGG